MIEHYSVKTVYEGIEGSGVLVKVDARTCYIISARHNFIRDDDIKNINLDVKDLKNNLNKIVLKTKNNTMIFIEELVYFNNNFDLMVFKIESSSDYIRKLSPIELLKDDLINLKCQFYGYPNEVKSGLSKKNLLILDKPDSNHIRLNNGQMKSIEDEEGFSGSGIFVSDEFDTESEKDSINYLIGIVIKAHEGQRFYVALELSTIIDEINDNLEVKIPVKHDIFDMNLTKQIYTRIMNRNENNNMIIEINQILNKKITLDKIDMNPTIRDNLINFLDMNESILMKERKRLADMYLLCGFIYNSTLDTKKKATKYFNLATKFNSNYRIYKDNKLGLEYELNRNKESFINALSPYELANWKLHNKEYTESEQLYLNLLDKDNTIEIYYQLIKIYSETNNNEQLIHIYKNIVISDLVDNTEKIRIYSELSKIYRDLKNEKEANKFAQMGLILMDTSSNRLEDKELTLSLMKQSSIQDELQIRQLLEELVEINPSKYLEEYLSYTSLSSNIGKTNKEVYSKISDIGIILEDEESKINQKLVEIENEIKSHEETAIDRFNGIFKFKNIFAGSAFIVVTIILGILIGTL